MKWFFINLNLIFLAHIDTIIYSTFNYLSRKKGKDTWSVQFILTALSSIEFHPHFFLLPLSPFLSSKGRKTREREREKERETFRIGRFNPPDDIYSRESYSRIYIVERVVRGRDY